MAERRMIAKTIVDSDAFLDTPQSSQNLYFHLNIRADDEGFVNGPLKIMRMIGGNKNDMDILVAKNYIIVFESGVVVVKHWKIHNLIRKDRMKETVYTEEKMSLTEKDNGSYTLGQPNDNQMTTKCLPRLVEVSVGKERLEEVSLAVEKPTKAKPKKKKYLEFVLLADDEYNKLVEKFGESGAKHRIKDMDDGIAIKGYKYKSHYRAILKWAEKDEVNDKKQIFDNSNYEMIKQQRSTPEEKAERKRKLEQERAEAKKIMEGMKVAK